MPQVDYAAVHATLCNAVTEQLQLNLLFTKVIFFLMIFFAFETK